MEANGDMRDGSAKIVEKVTECKLLNAPLVSPNDVCDGAIREFDIRGTVHVRIKEVRSSEPFSAMTHINGSPTLAKALWNDEKYSRRFEGSE